MAGAAEVHEQNNKRGARGKQSAIRHYVETAGDDRAGIKHRIPANRVFMRSAGIFKFALGTFWVQIFIPVKFSRVT